MAAGTIGFVQLGLAASIMGARKVFRNKGFLQKPEVQALREEHKKHFGNDINEEGYPDTGSGKYAQLLDYSDWVEFNNAQRSHLSMVEHSAPVLTSLILNGFFNPRAAAALGVSFAIGRVLYAMGYKSKAGANGRTIGSIISGVAAIGLYGLLLYNGMDRLQVTGVLQKEM
jgi:hypothetical protein